MRWLFAVLVLGALVIFAFSLATQPKAYADSAQAVMFNCDANPEGDTPGANTIQPGSFFSTDPSVTPTPTSCVRTNQTLLNKGYRLSALEFIDDTGELMHQLWLKRDDRD